MQLTADDMTTTQHHHETMIAPFALVLALVAQVAAAPLPKVPSDAGITATTAAEQVARAAQQLHDGPIPFRVADVAAPDGADRVGPWTLGLRVYRMRPCSLDGPSLRLGPFRAMVIDPTSGVLLETPRWDGRQVRRG